MYLGVRAVIAKSFERIHTANLINFGILPLIFCDERDYDKIEQGDELKIANVRELITAGSDLLVDNIRKKYSFSVTCNLSARQKTNNSGWRRTQRPQQEAGRLKNLIFPDFGR